MLGHRLLRDLEMLGDLTHRQRLIPHQQQHRPATRFGQRRQSGLRGHQVSVGPIGSCFKVRLV